MKFRINCPCGDHIEVGEGAAGATFQCACGRPISVPSLTELRTRAGLPANHISPEFVIEHLLVTGELVCGNSCVECGIDTDALIHVQTECERVFKVRSGDFSWPLFLFLLVFCPLFWGWYLWAFILVRASEEEHEYGRDKIYPLPLRICLTCQQKLKNPALIKQCLRKIAEYDLLLEKFPDAKVSLGK
jgi:hypothetical protein